MDISFHNGVRKINKNKIIFLILIPILAFSSCGLFSYWLNLDDQTRPLPLPKEDSIKNTVSLASDGCCFLVENIEISLFDSEMKVVVLKKDAIYQRERFDIEMPTEISSTDVSTEITFDYMYAKSGTETVTFIPSVSFEELRKSGFMIYFQERGGMFMLVVHGNYKNLQYRGASGQQKGADHLAPFPQPPSYGFSPFACRRRKEPYAR